MFCVFYFTVKCSKIPKRLLSHDCVFAYAAPASQPPLRSPLSAAHRVFGRAAHRPRRRRITLATATTSPSPGVGPRAHRTRVHRRVQRRAAGRSKGGNLARRGHRRTVGLAHVLPRVGVVGRLLRCVGSVLAFQSLVSDVLDIVGVSSSLLSSFLRARRSRCRRWHPRERQVAGSLCRFS